MTSHVDQDEFRGRLQRALGSSLELRGTLGRGGFAEVFVAWDGRLKRELAIKTVRPDLGGSPDLVERFRREAEAVAMLRHPHIIPIYTVGESEGIAFFTMPRIVGETLAALLQREGSVDIGLGCRIIIETAAALEVAHRAGVVHRDIKPDNIMLEGPEQRTIVMDFGIAKTGPAHERGLTRTGMAIGTPDFMSPEQAAGDRELDHRTDQYSLALVAFRMFAGVRSFDANSLRRMQYEQGTSLPTLISDVNPSVPRRAAEAIRRALSPDPADRFPSIAEFASAVASGFGVITGPGRLLARRERDWPTRVRAMVDSTSRWRLMSALAAAGILAFAGTWRSWTPVAGYRIVAEREDAIFAARSWLGARGITQPRYLLAQLKDNGARYPLLQKILGRAGADDLAYRDGLVWWWEVSYRDSADTRWQVDVGSRGRVIGFEHAIPDTASRPTVDDSTAVTLARAALVQFGYSLDSLLFLGDSAIASIRSLRRMDRQITWRWRGRMLPGLARDSVDRRVTVRVVGDRVEAIGTQLHRGAATVQESSRPPAFDYIGLFLPPAVVVLVVLLFATLFTRQRTDTLQWTIGGRFILVALVLALPAAATSLWRDVVVLDANGSRLLAGLTALFLISIMSGLGLCTVVAAESIAAEHRPTLFEGVRDVLSGRVLVPEVASAALRGVVAGCVTLGIVSLVGYIGVRAGGPVPASLSLIVNSSMRAILFMTSLSMLAVAVLAFCALTCARMGLPDSLAIPVVAILPFLSMTAYGGESFPNEIAQGTILGVAITWTTLRWGVLAGVVATAIAIVIPQVVPIATEGRGEQLAVVVISTLGLLFVPLAAGVLAYSKVRRR